MSIKAGDVPFLVVTGKKIRGKKLWTFEEFQKVCVLSYPACYFFDARAFRSF